jgi:FixJ family two-component response regulator
VSSLFSGHHLTLIILDDDLTVCRALKLRLESFGFEVLVFHSAESVLACNIQ